MFCVPELFGGGEFREYFVKTGCRVLLLNTVQAQPSPLQRED